MNPESSLFITLKDLLQKERFSTQVGLAKALAQRGFNNMSQARVARLLQKLGAIKTRDSEKALIYRLPNKKEVPRLNQTLGTIILEVKHNHNQLVIKTVIGGAKPIATIIETLGEAKGILACIASDNAVLVIPTDVELLNDIKDNITELFALALK